MDGRAKPGHERVGNCSIRAENAAAHGNAAATAGAQRAA
jgi:hypothetical protein